MLCWVHKKLGGEGAQPGQLMQAGQRDILYHVTSCSVGTVSDVGQQVAEYLPENTSDAKSSVDAKEELLDDCENIWKQMEEYQSRLVGKEAVLKPGHKVFLLMMRMKALTAEYNQWQKRNPEIISTNPVALLTIGKEELQKVKNDLERVLTAVQSKNQELTERLEREQQWHEEQQQILDVLNGIEEERRHQVEQLSRKSLNTRALNELRIKILKLKKYKEELLNGLGEFLEEHFPPPEYGGSAKKNSSEELISLHEILEILINKLMSTPHEPYVRISDSFWPPYIELLLRYGIALRHPEDPNRIRLEAFHI
ncbi:centromere protein K isoform X2 [Phalacrocorax carbo]|uniref:centromere protein K isoform X2 n=1 Tax=Phalacrocorax carbo TaxID=9209 RepID=UPI00311A3FEB